MSNDTRTVSGPRPGGPTVISPRVHGSALLCRPGAISATLMVFLGAMACEGPQPPAACEPIPQVTVNATETATVTACFNDPNGDMLSYSATSSSPGVATVSTSGTNVTVSAVSPGSASITVTARDPGGLTAQQTFQVTVPNRAPVAVGTIADLEVEVDSTVNMDVARYFEDPDGDPLTYEATSSGTTGVDVSASGSVVTVRGLSKGDATVTVTARDPGGLTAQQTFQVTVPNRAPVAVGTIADLEVEVDSTVNMDVARYFEDPDGDPLTYEATSSGTTGVDVSASGSVVTVRGLSKGDATVTVTARDPEGLMARQIFGVTVPNPDRAVLVAIYDALGGDNWTTNTNWKTDAPLDTWYGVTTNADEQVIRLELRENGLAGTIPAAVERLRALEWLDFSVNRIDEGPSQRAGDARGDNDPRFQREGFGAEHPEREGRSMSSLSDGITGPIPPGLGKLSQLEFLSLSYNSLTGPIPPELSKLSQLEELYLWGNSLTGTIPPELGDLSRLIGLSLSWNSLTGPIPPELGKLSQLKILYLWGNSLTGTIPPELGDLSRLIGLSLSFNSLTGTIPRELGDLSNLELLVLNANSLTGTLPRDLGDLPDLEELYVWGNPLADTIPHGFVDLSLTAFWWYDTNLCAPSTKVFQDWLRSIDDHQGGKTCPPPAAFDLPDPTTPPSAPGEEEPVVFDLGNGVAWGPIIVVNTDGRAIRVIPSPPGSVRWPLPRREVHIGPRRPPGSGSTPPGSQLQPRRRRAGLHSPSSGGYPKIERVNLRASSDRSPPS
jgi:Leucine-rich repeat (LRR) protein